MNYEGIILENEGGIAVLTLNRPQSLNAMTVKSFTALQSALKDAGRDDTVKVLILTGAGRGFCAGADFSALDEFTRMTQEQLKKDMLGITLALYELPVPVIAAINGVAAGAGLAMSLVCDMRIASDSARFTSGYVKMGLIPDVGETYFLPRLIGDARANELLFTGDMIDAAEAYRIGLVNRVFPEAELMKNARELAGKIAAGPSIAIELTRQALRKGRSNTLAEQIHLESSSFFNCLKTEDHKEGLKAFLEKRPPRFKGK